MEPKLIVEQRANDTAVDCNLTPVRGVVSRAAERDGTSIQRIASWLVGVELAMVVL